MEKAEQTIDHKSIKRHRSPSRTSQTTSDKMCVMLNLRTLHEITQKLEPQKRKLSDTPLTTPTKIIDCYEGTSTLLQPLDLD